MRRLALALSFCLVAGVAAPASAQPRPTAPARAFTKLSREDVEKLAFGAIEAKIGQPGTKLGKGVRVTQVRAPGPVDLPGPVIKREVEIVPPPRKAGSVATAATLLLSSGDGEPVRVALHVQLSVPAEAATWDVPKGSVVVLVVQRGLLEVTAEGVTAADADLGDVIPVLVRQSGRTLRARVTAKDRALVTEERR
jgi:hypothetical protein